MLVEVAFKFSSRHVWTINMWSKQNSQLLEGGIISC